MVLGKWCWVHVARGQHRSANCKPKSSDKHVMHSVPCMGTKNCMHAVEVQNPTQLTSVKRLVRIREARQAAPPPPQSKHPALRTCGAAQCFHTGQGAHDRVVARHLARAQRQASGHHCRQSLRNGSHRQSHCDLEVVDRTCACNTRFLKAVKEWRQSHSMFLKQWWITAARLRFQ
eukprot:1159745-Pelagomonas_calceolata.AAC.4